jgi:chromosome segregation ATPase
LDEVKLFHRQCIVNVICLTNQMTTFFWFCCSDKAREVETQLKDIASKYKEVQARYKERRNELKRLVVEARNEAPLQDDEGNETPLKALLEELAEFETIEQAEVALEEAEDQISRVVADPSIFRQYEKKKQELAVVRDDMEALTNRKEQRKNELGSRKEPWEEALQKIIFKIDVRFSQYMKELGCVGEVSLTKGETGDENEEPSFRNYGVEIRVSFREGVKPSVLSARVQSGGERSVSTIMYLMAMQDMMVAPFRCVDEINQGLDERNERLVFRRIVQNSTQPPGPKGPTDHSGQVRAYLNQSFNRCLKPQITF